MAMYFERSTPEEQGIHSDHITRFLQEVEGIDYQLRSFLLIRHGKLVAEVSRFPFCLEDHRLVYSVSKTFVSTAIGLAVGDGYLQVENLVLPFFPEYESLEMPDEMRRLTVQNLLMMSTGHDRDSIGDICNGDSDWVRTFFTRKVGFEPGERFVYDSGGTYMLSEIISRVTHMRMDEYLDEKLFRPLQITDVLWDRHGDVNTGGWGVFITPEDLAKLGLLYLQKGLFEGKRILSEQWVQEAAAGRINTGAVHRAGWSGEYGYQIWRNGSSGFRADGAFGQFCMVFPQEDMVMVSTAEEMDASRLFPYIEQCILTELSDQSYGKDPIVHGHLKRTIATWEMPERFSPTESYLEQLIHGEEFIIANESNTITYRLRILFRNSKMEVRLDDIQKFQSSCVGYQQGETGYVIVPPSVSPIISAPQSTRKWKYSARHEWVTDGILLLTVWYRETGHKQQWTFVFTGNQVEVIVSNGCKRLFDPLGATSDRNVDFADMVFRGTYSMAAE